MSYVKQWNFRIDAIKQHLGPLIDVIQQDTYSNKFVIDCLSNGFPIDLTDLSYASIVFAKSDTFNVVATAEVISAEKGRISVLVDYQALTALGVCNVGVKLFYVGGAIVTLQNFPINVVLDPYAGTDGDIESTSEYPLLIQLIDDVNLLETNVEAAEDLRVIAENDRIAAESDRLSAETTRISNENTRVSNENTRISNESTRVSNESLRISAEDARILSENNRISAEAIRISNEDNRELAETDRELAETTRQSNEIIREQFEFIGEYSAAFAYKMNNIISFNGYSYIALQDTTGNQPPEPPTISNAYWSMIAKKGDKGADLVYRGTYSEIITYAQYDLVKYIGGLYICLQTSTGNQPDISPTYFELWFELSGDMLKSVYDTNDSGVVDNSEKLGGQLPAYYASEADLTTLELRVDGAESDISTLDGRVSTAENNIIQNAVDITNTHARIYILGGN